MRQDDNIDNFEDFLNPEINDEDSSNENEELQLKETDNRKIIWQAKDFSN